MFSLDLMRHQDDQASDSNDRWMCERCRRGRVSGCYAGDASGDTPGIQAHVSIGDMLAMLSERFIRMPHAACCLGRSCRCCRAGYASG